MFFRYKDEEWTSPGNARFLFAFTFWYKSLSWYRVGERETELGSKVTLRGVSVACSQFFWVALFLHENVLFLDQISAPLVQRNIFHFFFSFVILFYFSRFPSICNFHRELILIFPFILIFPSFYWKKKIDKYFG